MENRGQKKMVTKRLDDRKEGKRKESWQKGGGDGRKRVKKWKRRRWKVCRSGCQKFPNVINSANFSWWWDV
jgi:hypothetical protein